MTVLEATTQVLANQAAQQAQLDSITQTLQLILSAVAGPATPAGVVITLTEGALKNMAKKAAGAAVDFQILDNGTATATLSFVDSLGEPTTIQSGATVSTTWTSSDPEISATGSADGLSAALAAVVASGAPLSTGVVITAVTTVTNPDGSTVGPFTATGDPIDVIAGGPAGVQIAEA